MDNAGYVSLTRQSGLLKELQTVANNIANISTTGFKREGVVFSEFVKTSGADSISFADAHGRLTDTSQGMLAETGGTLDFAIDGEGFFLLATPNCERLTRAGSFTSDNQGELVSNDGYQVLDIGGAPIFIPPNAKNIALAPDGTLSADGLPFTQIGIFVPQDAGAMIRESGVMFRADGGYGQATHRQPYFRRNYHQADL
ncbi:MAG: flagellar hook-basal body complex protein [Proteobacteria bacterium]|nr:flagellar hook-basal body complex protein [Pseudomonadota bacterium]